MATTTLCGYLAYSNDKNIVNNIKFMVKLYNYAQTWTLDVL